jgi:predicted secreted hydrolase
MDHDEFELEAIDRWESPRGGTYPAGWRLDLAPLNRTLTVTPIMADQELDLTVRYWEGAVDVTIDDAPAGRGYVELSGYAESSGR